jgi:hypothetical protein
MKEDQPPAPLATPLSFFLSKPEFQATYALAFALEASGEGEESPSFGESLKAAIRRLHRAGYDYVGLRIDDHGGIVPKGGIIEPKNELYLHMLSLGVSPDYRHACDALVELLDRHQIHEPRLRDLATWARDLVYRQAKEAPEPPDEFKQQTVEALNAVGIAALGEGRSH